MCEDSWKANLTDQEQISTRAGLPLPTSCSRTCFFLGSILHRCGNSFPFPAFPQCCSPFPLHLSHSPRWMHHVASPRADQPQTQRELKEEAAIGSGEFYWPSSCSPSSIYAPHRFWLESYRSCPTFQDGGPLLLPLQNLVFDWPDFLLPFRTLELACVFLVRVPTVANEAWRSRRIAFVEERRGANWGKAWPAWEDKPCRSLSNM